MMVTVGDQNMQECKTKICVAVGNKLVCKVDRAY